MHNTALNAAIVVSPRGLTLYHMTVEKGKKVVCTGQCTVFWPPLLVRKGGKMTAGAGVNAKKLGTIRRPNGHYQVTYAGLPLYSFVSDKRRGDVKGEGVQKIWYAVSPTGRIVKPPA